MKKETGSAESTKCDAIAEPGIHNTDLDHLSFLEGYERIQRAAVWNGSHAGLGSTRGGLLQRRSVSEE